MRTIISSRIAFADRIDTQAGRSICQHNGRDSQTGYRISGARSTGNQLLGSANHRAVTRGTRHSGTDNQARLFFQRHSANDILNGIFTQLGSRRATSAQHACEPTAD